MLLSITIPTYNRAQILDKNLSLISSLIINNHLEKEVDMIISNNQSTDNTKDIVEKYLSTGLIKYYYQDKSIGGPRNTVFSIGVADGDYVMVMGDDDFMSNDFFISVINLLKENPNLDCIVPNFVNLMPNGTCPNKSRDYKYHSKFYAKGLKSCLSLAWRGHQMSGLVFKRSGLYEYFKANRISTMYPQVCMVAIRTLHGESYHLTEFPIKVSQPGQDQKDWGYGTDGLIVDALGGIKRLDESYFCRTIIQCSIINHFISRIKEYKKWWLRRRFFCAVFFDSRTMFISKINFLIWCLIFDAYFILRRTFVKKIYLFLKRQ